MKTPREITISELNAYVDGELDGEMRGEVEIWLADHPEDAVRVSAYRKQKEALHMQFDPILQEPVPDGMRETVLASRFRAGRYRWLNIAATILMMFVGGAAGWGLRSLYIGDAPKDPVTEFATRARGAHSVYVTEVKHPVEVDAKQEAHLVAWLSKRLGHPLQTPDLESGGFQLVGGRLLPDVGRAAAQFMYEDSQNRRLTVYVRPYQGSNMAFRFTDHENTSTFYWIDSPFAYAVSGQIPRQNLLKLAHLIYGNLYKASH